MVSLAAGIFIFPFSCFNTAGKIADKYEKSQIIQRIKYVEVFLMWCNFRALFEFCLDFNDYFIWFRCTI